MPLSFLLLVVHFLLLTSYEPKSESTHPPSPSSTAICALTRDSQSSRSCRAPQRLVAAPRTNSARSSMMVASLASPPEKSNLPLLTSNVSNAQWRSTSTRSRPPLWYHCQREQRNDFVSGKALLGKLVSFGDGDLEVVMSFVLHGVRHLLHVRFPLRPSIAGTGHVREQHT